MVIPIKVALRTKKGDIRDIASMLEHFQVDESVVEDVFTRFRDILRQQLQQNRHTTGYKAGSYLDKRGYTAKVSKDYTPGAFIGSLRYQLVPKSDGGLVMRIEMGGMDTERPGATGRFVKYSRLIDQAFGPYVREISTNQAFFGARRGQGGQFTRLRPGVQYKMHQPINSAVAWMQALQFGKQLLDTEGRDSFRSAMDAFSVSPRSGKRYYGVRNTLGRFTKKETL